MLIVQHNIHILTLCKKHPYEIIMDINCNKYFFFMLA